MVGDSSFDDLDSCKLNCCDSRRGSRGGHGGSGEGEDAIFLSSLSFFYMSLGALLAIGCR